MDACAACVCDIRALITSAIETNTLKGLAEPDGASRSENPSRILRVPLKVFVSKHADILLRVYGAVYQSVRFFVSFARHMGDGIFFKRVQKVPNF